MYHPWRVFREQWSHVDLSYVAPPDGLDAITDGSTVWLNNQALQVERRCAIAHETVHLERGEHCDQDTAREASVDREAARRLITFSALVDAARWARTWQEGAEELWVTPAIMLARIDTLTEHECSILHQVIGDRRA